MFTFSITTFDQVSQRQSEIRRRIARGRVPVVITDRIERRRHLASVSSTPSPVAASACESRVA